MLTKFAGLQANDKIKIGSVHSFEENFLLIEFDCYLLT